MSIPCVLSLVWHGTGLSQAQATRSDTGASVPKEAPCLGCLQLTLKLGCIRRNFILKNVISQLPFKPAHTAHKRHCKNVASLSVPAMFISSNW